MHQNFEGNKYNFQANVWQLLAEEYGCFKIWQQIKRLHTCISLGYHHRLLKEEIKHYIGCYKKCVQLHLPYCDI